LAPAEYAALDDLVRRHSTPQHLALRARAILAAAAGRNNARIARDLAVSLRFVRLWRARWLLAAACSLEDLPVPERLADAPRPGRPPIITTTQTCQIVALACAAPALTGRPLSHWTHRELAEAIVAQGILPRISPRHAGRLLKRGTSNPIAFVTG